MNIEKQNVGAGRVRIALLAAVLLSALVLLVLVLADRPERKPQRATVLSSPLQLPDFSLVDHNKLPFGRTSLENRWSLVFFGFTHCPDICPLTLQKLAVARRQLAEQGITALPLIVFVSVDPERDSIEAIGQYAGAFGDGVLGVTGTLDDINVLTSALGIFHARPPTADGGYDVEHSAAVLLMNPDADLKAIFSAPHDVESFAHDVALVMDSR